MRPGRRGGREWPAPDAGTPSPSLHMPCRAAPSRWRAWPRAGISPAIAPAGRRTARHPRRHRATGRPASLRRSSGRGSPRRRVTVGARRRQPHAIPPRPMPRLRAARSGPPGGHGHPRPAYGRGWRSPASHPAIPRRGHGRGTPPGTGRSGRHRTRHRCARAGGRSGRRRCPPRPWRRPVRSTGGNGCVPARHRPRDHCRAIARPAPAPHGRPECNRSQRRPALPPAPARHRPRSCDRRGTGREGGPGTAGSPRGRNPASPPGIALSDAARRRSLRAGWRSCGRGFRVAPRFPRSRNRPAARSRGAIAGPMALRPRGRAAAPPPGP